MESGDAFITQASSAAKLAYEQGNFGQSKKLFRLALMRAQAINDAALAADAAYNLAMCEIGLGDYDSAAQLLRQAYYDAIRASSNTADIQLVRAKVAFLRTKPLEALTFLDEIAASNPTQSIQLQAIIVRGQIFGDAGDRNAANSELRAAESLVASSRVVISASVGADLAKLAGTVSRLEGKTDIAARFFDDEAELLRNAHRYRDMAYALARAAEAYLASGGLALAADRFFLAGRSLEGHGDTQAAKSLLASSVSAAKAAADQDARVRAETLLEEITRRHVP
jgi:tetratricopeptide (TPR) repeat protein